MNKKEWEALCDGCGKCCAIPGAHGKEGKCYACPGLNVKTNKCVRYSTRFEKDIVCLKVSPDNVLPMYAKGILPDSCAYVRHAQKKPPLEHVEKAEHIAFNLAPLGYRRKYHKGCIAWHAEVERVMRATSK